ncbi:MAG: DUF1818 family protein [Cyanobacteria bacterium P01_F01_bin.33]
MTEFFERDSDFLHGDGWRVGWLPGKLPYCALVGGDTWAFELTEAEWRDFVAGLHHLAEAMRMAATELMALETLTLERNTELLSLTMTGLVGQCELHVQLRSERLAEGLWAASAVPKLVEAVLHLEMRSGVI